MTKENTKPVDPTTGARIGDLDPAELEQQLARHLLTSAAQGSTAAAGLLVRVAEISMQRQQTLIHRQRLDAAKDAPTALVEYLAELGLTPSEIREDWLRREMTADEVAAFETGQRSRTLEARALELAKARLGTVSPPDWMTKRFRASST